MKYAADFRELACNALEGRWPSAVLAGFLAVLLGASDHLSPEINVTLNGGRPGVDVHMADTTVVSSSTGSFVQFFPDLSILFSGVSIFLFLAALSFFGLYLFVGSSVGVGYARYNLDLIDRNEVSYVCLFDYFSYWKHTMSTRILKFLYVLVGYLLFVIPGIIFSYQYSMTDYILAEHPQLTAMDAMEASKEMMQGNKLRLFCLQFSFLGWMLLCCITLGWGNLLLFPYMKAAEAAFYREVSGTEQSWIQEDAA